MHLLIMENCPKSIMTNPQFLDGIRVALQRGLKSTTDILAHAGVPYIDINTINHIFRGSNNSGVHHISALMADPSTYKIHNRIDIPNSSGCYRAKIYKNGTEMYSGHPDGKSFFPDTWNENQVIDAIKQAHTNPLPNSDPNNFIGTSTTGLQIRIIKNNGVIV